MQDGFYACNSVSIAQEVFGAYISYIIMQEGLNACTIIIRFKRAFAFKTGQIGLQLSLGIYVSKCEAVDLSLISMGRMKIRQASLCRKAIRHLHYHHRAGRLFRQGWRDYSAKFICLYLVPSSKFSLTTFGILHLQ